MPKLVDGIPEHIDRVESLVDFDRPSLGLIDVDEGKQHIELVAVVGALRRAPLGFDLSERRAVILCARIGRMSIMLSSKPRNDDCVDAVILCVGTNDRTKRFGS